MPKTNHIRELKDNIKENKITFAVYVVLRAFVITSLIISLMRGDLESAFVCLLSLILFLVPSFLEKSLKIYLPSVLEIIVLLFIFAAEILGELNAYYVKIPFWDTMLHTINGFLCAAVGFALIDILNRNDKFKFQLSPLYVAIVAFCFSMTIGVLWEFFEFGVDLFLGFDMQKDTIIKEIRSVALDPTKTNTVVSIQDIKDVTIDEKALGVGGYLDIGLFDTMEDLLVNFIGATVFSILGFFYIKTRGKGKIAKNFIPTLRKGTE
ncbi:MAG: hypothetical protein J6V50_00795 [Clostridia bacterium]|nr:hypothetical protein [Clostridia bacterium]